MKNSIRLLAGATIVASALTASLAAPAMMLRGASKYWLKAVPDFTYNT